MVDVLSDDSQNMDSTEILGVEIGASGVTIPLELLGISKEEAKDVGKLTKSILDLVHSKTQPSRLFGIKKFGAAKALGIGLPEAAKIQNYHISILVLPEDEG